MSYHVSRDGTPLGIYPLNTLRDHLSTGKLKPSDHGWTAGMTGWRTLAEIAPSATPPPLPANPAREPTPPPKISLSASAAKHHGRPRRRSKPNSHLGAAILVTLLCPPVGIPAIVYASKVNDLYKSGDQLGARIASHKAKFWIRASLVVGLVGVLLYASFTLIGASMSQ